MTLALELQKVRCVAPVRLLLIFTVIVSAVETFLFGLIAFVSEAVLQSSKVTPGCKVANIVSKKTVLLQFICLLSLLHFNVTILAM